MDEMPSEENPNWQLRLQEFFETETALKACSPLQPGAAVILVIKNTRSPESLPVRIGFEISRKREPALHPHATVSNPQATLTLDSPLTAELLELKTEEIADYGILILSAFLESPRRLHVKLHSGFVELWRKGWFGVLALGGTQLTRYLASQGLDGIGGIQRAIQALRSKNT